MADAQERDRLRAAEWCFHYLRGNVERAVEIETVGPVKPAYVVAAVVSHLADRGLALVPMEPDAASEKERG